MELPSISIVTPCLNAVDTIAETLASVREQRYPHLEHIVVDGGSTDGTLELLERADGISYSSEPDEGRPDAANKGVSRASGELIGFLNADDCYEPGALRAVGEASPATRRRCGPPATAASSTAAAGDPAPVTAYKNLLLRRFSFPLYLTQNFVSDPATFVRRAALDEVGLLDNRYRISHDYDLWLRVARRWEPVVLGRYLSSFRMVEGTLSMAGFERQFREHEEVARLHGRPPPALANAATSRLIVLVYSALRARRRRGCPARAT